MPCGRPGKEQELTLVAGPRRRRGRSPGVEGTKNDVNRKSRPVMTWTCALS
jgi:hypothetical protein